MGDGLQFRVVAGKTGINRSWVLRFTLNGKADNMGLGRYPDVTESVARQRADEYRRLAKQGIDPKAHRDAQAVTVKAKEVAAKAQVLKSITFEEMAEEWITARRDEWKSVGRDSNEKICRSKLSTYVYPLLGALPVREIDTDLMLRVLNPIWKTMKKADTVRGLIERVLEMAGAHKYREGENPASWKILRHLLPSPSLIHKTKNFVALPYDQIPAFMAKLRSVDSTAARALELAILCGGRTDEIRCATWGEFDLGARMWVIPAERTKTGKKSGQDHHVPLPDRAIDILNKMPRVSDYVFPGRYANRNLNAAIPLGEGAMLDQLRAICDYRDRDGDPVTVHGFRSTFNDWAGDQTEFDRDTIQMQLAHKVVKGSEAAYRRMRALEKRRRLVDAWSDYCMGRSNVVPFQKGAV